MSNVKSIEEKGRKDGKVDIGSTVTVKEGDYPEEFEIRGEILFPHDGFLKLNKEREAEGEQLFANPRNAASGTLKMQKSSLVAKRPLDCYLYYVLGEKLPYDTEELGF